MSGDIVKKLRVPPDLMTDFGRVGLFGEAAAEIERLRVRVAKLDKALEEIAEYCCDENATVSTIQYAILRALGGNAP
jgi:hypothetical protein